MVTLVLTDYDVEEILVRCRAGCPCISDHAHLTPIGLELEVLYPIDQ